MKRVNALFMFYFISFIIFFSNLSGQLIKKWGTPDLAVKAQAVITPSKGFYLEGDVIEFNISFELDNEMPAFQIGCQVDIVNENVSGYENDYFRVLSSTLDTILVINESSSVLNGLIIVKTKKDLEYVMISFDAYKVEDNNYNIQQKINEGEIPPDYPNLDWYRSHTTYKRISFYSNTTGLPSPKKYPLKELDEGRLYYNLMFQSFFHICFFNEDGNYENITSLQVYNTSTQPAFHLEGLYAPEIIHDQDSGAILAKVRTKEFFSYGQNLVTGTVALTYDNSDLGYEVYTDYEFIIINGVNLTFTLEFEKNDLVFDSPEGFLNLYSCWYMNWNDCNEYDPSWLLDQNPIYSEQLTPYQNDEYSQIEITNFQSGFMGFEIVYSKEFLTLLELPGEDETVPINELIQKKYWVTIYHPEVYYTNEGSYNAIFSIGMCQSILDTLVV
ncbi:MAG: hypothetical protein APR54_12520 [Candidatus Cloacimonas sp. SDB]|nr:MAG: hypothetical protein APR54_12520 [Candidatus Cloacimonas sp. SDB]